MSAYTLRFTRATAQDYCVHQHGGVHDGTQQGLFVIRKRGAVQRLSAQSFSKAEIAKWLLVSLPFIAKWLTSSEVTTELRRKKHYKHLSLTPLGIIANIKHRT